MKIAYCQNCGKNTGHKRAVGAGTILGAVLTSGVSLLAVPSYGKRCVICGLTVEEAEAAARQPAISPVTTTDKIQGWLVLFVVIGVVLLLLHCTHTE